MIVITYIATYFKVRLNDALLEDLDAQLRQRGEICSTSILPTILPAARSDSSFFNGAYGQHMYHPMLVFEHHTGSKR